ncbi:histone deacetylase [Moraxella sp. FZLJ2107]|uniref:histone deacetylase family protein n=1 Tax=unclassified Moraxella TaxID=2685852 RepID=UPI0020C91E56|nr:MULTISPECIES: histone deacetylase [unclassified Moraxella]UTO06063.1 histone deacetylase [Moraxella sp. FZLJ2107]UTO22800.1 histone deacetylase [Moraxella sp. FZLJ2109]
MLKIAHSPIFCHAVPDGHRFPMAKYRLLPERLLADGIIRADDIFAPQLLSADEILTTHTAEYWHKLETQALSAKEARAIGLPMSPELVLRERYICHATYECALYAKQYGISLSTSGGTHHAFADRGEGFCVMNDICVASNLLLKRNQAKRILIVDLDVHQGNGNAAIMADNPAVFVFSMHGEKNYPYHKPKSDLDIALADDTGDDEYLEILSNTLPKIIAEFTPDMIFYQAGVDVLAVDKLGKLSLTLDGCYQSDEIVLTMAHQLGIPVAVVMGGGYAPDIDVIVQAHMGVFGVARSLIG